MGILRAWITVYVLLIVNNYAALTGHGREKKLSASTKSDLCHYTVVVNEFDASRCKSTMTKDKYIHIADHHQADGVGVTGNEQHKNVKYTLYDKAEELDGTVKSQLDDIESKLLDEMVKNRELNATLRRQEMQLELATRTIDGYKGNLTHVFRVMMQIERKLKHQRRVNRSLNKKLSNVILDVVEVNNVLNNKLPKGDATRSSKSFKVESIARITSCPGITNETRHYKDCLEVYEAGHHRSDVYYIKALYGACPIPVWCDMESPKAGWLVFQRRRDGSESFDRDWNQYRAGFGDVSAEHWLGNDNLFLLTNQERYQMRIDLWDFGGNRVNAIYSSFRVEGERDDYRLHISGFSGSAQDSLHRHNNEKFSTRDHDNDNRREGNCAQEWEAGWWFDNCWFALLNGPYHNRSDVSWRGIAWNHWKREQLRASEMKIRPLRNTAG